MLEDLFPNQYSDVDPPLWTLSSTLIVFPIICYLAKKMKDDRRYLWGCGYISVIGSFCWSIVENAGYPFPLLRGFFTILAGCVICFVVRTINRIGTKIVKCFVPIIGIISFIISIAMCYFRMNMLDLFTAVCAVSIMCTASEAGNILKGNRITDLLGKISMIVYIVHYQSIWVVIKFFEQHSINDKIKVYYFSVVVLTLFAYIIVEMLLNRMASKGNDRMCRI